MTRSRDPPAVNAPKKGFRSSLAGSLVEDSEHDRYTRRKGSDSTLGSRSDNENSIISSDVDSQLIEDARQCILRYRERQKQRGMSFGEDEANIFLPFMPKLHDETPDDWQLEQAFSKETPSQIRKIIPMESQSLHWKPDETREDRPDSIKSHGNSRRKQDETPIEKPGKALPNEPRVINPTGSSDRKQEIAPQIVHKESKKEKPKPENPQRKQGGALQLEETRKIEVARKGKQPQKIRPTRRQPDAKTQKKIEEISREIQRTCENGRKVDGHRGGAIINLPQQQQQQGLYASRNDMVDERDDCLQHYEADFEDSDEYTSRQALPDFCSRQALTDFWDDCLQHYEADFEDSDEYTSRQALTDFWDTYFEFLTTLCTDFSPNPVPTRRGSMAKLEYEMPLLSIQDIDEDIIQSWGASVGDDESERLKPRDIAKDINFSSKRLDLDNPLAIALYDENKLRQEVHKVEIPDEYFDGIEEAEEYYDECFELHEARGVPDAVAVQPKKVDDVSVLEENSVEESFADHHSIHAWSLSPRRKRRLKAQARTVTNKPEAK